MEVRLQMYGDPKPLNGRTDGQGQVVFDRVPDGSWDMSASWKGKELNSHFSMLKDGHIIMINSIDLTKEGMTPMVKKMPDGTGKETDLVFSLRSSPGNGKWWAAKSYYPCSGAPTGEQLRRLRFNP